MKSSTFKRLIPVLFIKNGKIVRSRKFKVHQVIGNVIQQAKRLNDWDVDELIYIDISRQKTYDYGRDDLSQKSLTQISEIIFEIGKVCFMPLSFGGGIRSILDVDLLIKNGADKIIINNLLFSNPKEVKKIVKKYGSQAVIGSLDYKKIDDRVLVFSNYGANNLNISLLEAVRMIEDLGVGEIFLQNINYDGIPNGFDLEQIGKVTEILKIPVIACSGAGKSSHFEEVSKIDNLSGIAAGNIFNFKEDAYQEIKKVLKEMKVNVR